MKSRAFTYKWTYIRNNYLSRDTGKPLTDIVTITEYTECGRTYPILTHAKFTELLEKWNKAMPDAWKYEEVTEKVKVSDDTGKEIGILTAITVPIPESKPMDWGAYTGLGRYLDRV